MKSEIEEIQHQIDHLMNAAWEKRRKEKKSMYVFKSGDKSRRVCDVTVVPEEL